MHLILRSVVLAVLSTVLWVAPLTSAEAIESAPPTITARDQAPARTEYARCWKRQRKCFSAISLNVTTGNAFLAINKMSKRGAIRTAKRKCAGHASPGGCRAAGWVTNGWLAVYYRVNGNGVALDWASGIAYSESGARRRAANRLAGPGDYKFWCAVGTDRTPTKEPRGRQAFGVF